MGRMERAGCEVDEERLVRSHRMLEAHPGYRLISHVGHEVVARSVRRLDMRHAVEDQRCPLVRFTAQEAVELFETIANRPAWKGAPYPSLPHPRRMQLDARPSV